MVVVGVVGELTRLIIWNVRVLCCIPLGMVKLLLKLVKWRGFAPKSWKVLQKTACCSVVLLPNRAWYTVKRLTLFRGAGVFIRGHTRIQANIAKVLIWHCDFDPKCIRSHYSGFAEMVRSLRPWASFRRTLNNDFGLILYQNPNAKSWLLLCFLGF